MSNDTDFKLTLKCPSLEELKHVLWYLHFKKSRCDFWQGTGAATTGLKARVGTKSGAAVVSWGFASEDDEPIVNSKTGVAHIEVTAWANQNTRNVWISGEHGELADLKQRFPFLTINGSYKDEYGSGEIEY